MPIELRAATIADVESVTTVFLACWRESYRGVLPDAAIEAMSDERALALWTRVLGSKEGEVLVADRGGEILGITRFVARDTAGAVYSLYVAPNTQGLGIGSRLLNAAAVQLAELGVRDATLWVFAANAPSIAFYRKNGWLPDGAERTQEEFGEPELRLARRLEGTS